MRPPRAFVAPSVGNGIRCAGDCLHIPGAAQVTYVDVPVAAAKRSPTSGLKAQLDCTFAGRSRLYLYRPDALPYLQQVRPLPSPKNLFPRHFSMAQTIHAPSPRLPIQLSLLELETALMHKIHSLDAWWATPEASGASYEPPVTLNAALAAATCDPYTAGLALMNFLSLLVKPCSAHGCKKWDPRSVVNYLVAQMRLRNVNPWSILEIQVLSTVTLQRQSPGDMEEYLASKTKLTVFARAELFYFGMPVACTLAPPVAFPDPPVASPTGSNPPPAVPSAPEAITVPDFSPSSPISLPGSPLTPLSSPSPEPVAWAPRKIPKPRGQAGHPNAGGYSVLQVLGWTNRRYLAYKKWLSPIVAAHLDVRLTLLQQNPNAVQKVCEIMCIKETELLLYEGVWPVYDMIRSTLRCLKRA